VGLIARQVEAAGIPTLSMTSALSITRAVHPPRAAFLDYPLGHTTGKPGDLALQVEILCAALEGFERAREPGTVEPLAFRWSESDDWKDSVMRVQRGEGGDEADDDRVERTAAPQYQCERDRELAEAALEAGGCPTCFFLDAEPTAQ